MREKEEVGEGVTLITGTPSPMVYDRPSPGKQLPNVKDMPRGNEGAIIINVSPVNPLPTTLSAALLSRVEDG